MNNKEKCKELMEKVKNYMLTNNCKGRDAIEQMLTADEYDFLIENDFNIDKFLYDSEEEYKKAVENGKVPKERKVKAGGYAKEYDDDKKTIYNLIIEILEKNNIQCITPNKINYRDLTIKVNNKHFTLILQKTNSKKV